jgi:hypothetical protein
VKTVHRVCGNGPVKYDWPHAQDMIRPHNGLALNSREIYRDLRRKIMGHREHHYEGRHHLITASCSMLLTFFVLAGHFQTVRAGDLSLVCESENISANISGIPFQKVMQTLAEKCNISILLDDSLKTQQINSKFENFTLEEGIKRLIKPYSSAMTFEKLTPPTGKVIFHVRELKVFDSSRKNTIYVSIAHKNPEQAEKDLLAPSTENASPNVITKEVAPPPDELKNPAKTAMLHKKISTINLQSKVTRKMAALNQSRQKAANEETRQRRKIQELEAALHAATGNDANRIRAQVASAKAEFRSMQKRNSYELEKLQSELEQLKYALNRQPDKLAQNIAN